jgi:hypothetical protein
VNTYSNDLINRTIKCFKEEHNHIINRETAIEYLDRLGGLFLVFAESPTNPNMNFNSKHSLTLQNLKHKKTIS